MNRIKFYTIVALLILSLVLGIFFIYLDKSYTDEESNFRNFKRDSIALVRLKQRWEIKKNTKKIFRRIKSISSPARDIRKNGTRILDFDNLSQEKLEGIAKIIFNSNVIVKAMDISKTKGKISLHVEVVL